MTPEERLERHERWLEEHDRSMAEHNRRMDQFDARVAAVLELGARTDARLNRAIRLAVREARAEREQRRRANAEFDDKITKITSSHLVMQEELKDLKATVQAFIDSLRRGGNGHHLPGPNNP